MLTLEQKLNLLSAFVELAEHPSRQLNKNSKLINLHIFLQDNEDIIKETVLKEVSDIVTLVYSNKEESGKVINIEILKKLLEQHRKLEDNTK